jgi:hypothetical protein
VVVLLSFSYSTGNKIKHGLKWYGVGQIKASLYLETASIMSGFYGLFWLICAHTIKQRQNANDLRAKT